MKTDYVDKEKLYAVLCDWYDRKVAAEAIGEQAPQLPTYVGQCILQMAEGLALRGNFRKYTWVEEMKGDGIVDAVRALNKFDPNKVSPKTGEVNPFGFINLILWRSFAARIKNENKKIETKKAMMLDPNQDFHFQSDFDSDEDFGFDRSELNEFFHKGN